MALVSIQAMASATEINKNIEANINGVNNLNNVNTINNSQNLNQQLKSVFDKQNFVSDKVSATQDETNVNTLNSAKVNNVYQKKAVREALEQSYPVIINNYGENNQILYDKYFQDIKDKIVKVTTTTKGTGNQDSTSLTNSQNTGYDNCYTSPTSTGENLAPAGVGCICHGACHGQCHGSRGWR